MLLSLIDDIHPEKGWGVEGDIQIEYLSEIIKNNMEQNLIYLFQVIIMVSIQLQKSL